MHNLDIKNIRLNTIVVESCDWIPMIESVQVSNVHWCL